MQISFSADPAQPDDLRKVVATATALLDASLGTGQATLPATATEPRDLEGALADLNSRIGDNSRRALLADAEMRSERDGFHDLYELAERLGVDINKARIYRANLKRSRKQMEKTVPGAPREFYEKKPGPRGTYFRLREDIAEAVLRVLK
jgi:hypothetical protein